MQKSVSLKNLVKKTVKRLLGWTKAIKLPFTGGLPLYWIGLFFFRNLKKEPISLRASSIAFNLFLSLFPALIFLFTLLPIIPIHDLNKEIYIFLKAIMPISAFTSIQDNLDEIMHMKSAKLLSIGIIVALYFASNGVYSLMQAFHKADKRSYLSQKLVSIYLTLMLGGVLIAGMTLFLGTKYLLELVTTSADKHTVLYSNSLIIGQWVMLFILLFGATALTYRFGDSRVEHTKEVLSGAVLTSILVVLTSIAYSYYVGKWANYSKLYGSLGTMIITMLWLYFNSMVIIVGHEYNRSLVHARMIIKRNKAAAKTRRIHNRMKTNQTGNSVQKT